MSNKFKNVTRKFQRGFTLVELIIVMVILGILAAFVIPRFLNLAQQARQATVNALAGNINAAAALVYSQAVVNGIQSTAAGTGVQVTMADGTVVTTNYGYPTSTATTGGIVNALSNINTTTDFSISQAGSTVTFSKVGAPTAANCQVTYTSPATAGSSYTTAVTSTCN